MNFPISEKYIYFDSARSGGMCLDLLSWREKHDNLFLHMGSQFRLNNDGFIDYDEFEKRAKMLWSLFCLESWKKNLI